MPFLIQRFKEIDSTSTALAAAARDGAPAGTVFIADFQTTGRGKPGNAWESPAGKNLLFSVLFRPQIPAHKAPYLTQVACRSVAKVLESRHGILCTFKRPNDLLVESRKICGVLTEASTSGGNRIDHVIVGIGLNVNAVPDSMRDSAACLSAQTGAEIDREKLFEQLLNQLEEDFRNVESATD